MSPLPVFLHRPTEGGVAMSVAPWNKMTTKIQASPLQASLALPPESVPTAKIFDNERHAILMSPLPAFLRRPTEGGIMV